MGSSATPASAARISTMICCQSSNAGKVAISIVNFLRYTHFRDKTTYFGPHPDFYAKPVSAEWPRQPMDGGSKTFSRYQQGGREEEPGRREWRRRPTMSRSSWRRPRQAWVETKRVHVINDNMKVTR